MDEPHNSDRVFFIYRQEHEDQASSTISALPLILREHVGPRCANWLTDRAEEEAAGWTYDKNTGRIKSKEDDYTSRILKGWTGDEEIEELFTNDVQVTIGGQQISNQFDDNGTVVTMASDLSGWSSSSNETPTVGRMLKKMQKLMET